MTPYVSTAVMAVATRTGTFRAARLNDLPPTDKQTTTLMVLGQAAGKRPRSNAQAADRIAAQRFANLNRDEEGTNGRLQ